MAYVSALDMAEKRADNADRWAKLNQRAHERRLRFVGDMNQGRDREEYKRLLSQDEIAAARAHEDQMQKDKLGAETEQAGYKAWGMQHQGESAAHENRLAEERKAKSALAGTKYQAKKGLEAEKYRSDKVLAGTKYQADKVLAGTKYQADKGLELEEVKGENSVLTEAEKNKGLEKVEQMRSREAQNAFEEKALITAMSIGQRPITGAEVEAARRIMFENKDMTFQQALEEVRKRGAANK